MSLNYTRLQRYFQAVTESFPFMFFLPVRLAYSIESPVYEVIMKNSLIGGTILLTITGLITRIIGFFYKIYLSNALGARLLGI